MSRPVDATAASLITLIERYAAHTGLSVSTVCRHAAGSGDVVARLLRGSTITIRRFDRAVRYLSEHWPAELAWPGEVPRPPK